MQLKHFTYSAIASALMYASCSYANGTEYKLLPSNQEQTIWGLGVELQLDSIGSDNLGLPPERTGIPHDLEPSERRRLYNDMLQGFRYARIALGLYYRGTTLDETRLAERYTGQREEMREIIVESGMEGAAIEYWSPTPAWKANGSYLGGGIADDIDFEEFGKAMLDDYKHIESGGIPIVKWGLQNEPNVGHGDYSTAKYKADGTDYLPAFKSGASKIRAYNPDIHIHVSSGHTGQHDPEVQLLHDDQDALDLVDAWSFHRIGKNSNEQIADQAYFLDKTHGKPVYNNEFEYLDGETSEYKLVNTASSIMNWMTFENSPTWYWLHALKPSYNSESEGYGLGIWRPTDDLDTSKYENIENNQWDYLNTNFHSVAGFLKYLPWNSVRFEVEETTVKNDYRIMGWTTPEGQNVFALTNKTNSAYTFNIDVSNTDGQFVGRRYDKNDRDKYIETKSGNTISVTVPAYSIEFWIEEDVNKPSVSVIANNDSICENGSCSNGSTSSFTLQRTGDTSQPLTVKLKDRSSAHNGTDFSSISLEQTFLANQASKTISLSAYDDSLNEIDEYVELEIEISPNYQVGDADRAKITIEDSITGKNNWVNIFAHKNLEEPSTNGQVRLTRTGDTSMALDVTLSTKDSTATSGVDYKLSTQPVTFGIGESEIFVDVEILNDGILFEGEESFSVEIVKNEELYNVGAPIADLTITEVGEFVIEVDNDDSANVNVIGSWTSSSYSDDRIGDTYLHDNKASKGSKTVEFSTQLPFSGNWGIYSFYNAADSRQSNVIHTVQLESGITEVSVDQSVNGGEWQKLGEFLLDKATASVTISNEVESGDPTNKYVIADAIQFRSLPIVIDNVDNVTVQGDWATSSYSSDRIGDNYYHDKRSGKGNKSVTYNWTAPGTGNFDLATFYASGSDRANNVPVDVIINGVTSTYELDQTKNGGKWVMIDNFQLSEGDDVEVVISNTGTPSNKYVIADAVAFVYLQE